MKFHDDYKKLEKNAKEMKQLRDQENQETFKSTFIQLFDVTTSVSNENWRS